MTDHATHTVAREDAIGQTVAMVMISAPKTLPSDSLVSDVRRAFERSNIRTVLLAQDGRFVGAIERGGLPADAPDDAAARGYVEADPLTVTPEMPMSEAIGLLEGRAEPRLIVLDADGVTLRGLLCAKPDGAHFCVR